MPKINYVPKRFRAESLAIIGIANQICQDYADMGFELTLRQLYYQFVSKALIENSDKSYRKLGSVINDARLAGLIDWNHLTDRTRNERSRASWNSPADVIETAATQFARNPWKQTDQGFQPYVWVEKDALIDVVGRAASPLFVPYFSCRGYVSQSEMWAASQRMIEDHYEGRRPVVLHLGDHDPSGIDMTRDIRDRLNLFGAEVEVIRLALNMDQIDEYGPPPNPAKLTDSRGSNYVHDYGYESWELDALNPPVIVQLITDAVEALITDRDSWEEVVEQDADYREKMSSVSNRWDEIYANWDEVERLLDSRV